MRFQRLTAVLAAVASFATASPALSGQRYVWITAVYNFSRPSYTTGGNVSCNTYFGTQVQCTKSPTYTMPGGSYSQRIRVHVDCKDRTLDAKGDRRGWKSWNNEPNLYPQLVRACRGY